MKAGNRLRIFISCSKYFGEQTIIRLRECGHLIVGVCAPEGDIRVNAVCEKRRIPVFNPETIHQAYLPGFDLGVSAYSMKILPSSVLNQAEIGWVGYHPSLLPRHRGPSSIEWAIKTKDPITGGTVYWLDEGIDTGDIERQRWVWLDHSLSAKELWIYHLQPIGLDLLCEAVIDISRGAVNRTPQDEKFATYEPALIRGARKTGT